MKLKHPEADARELAALHALGLMNEDEAGAFEGHLAEGCAICSEAIAAMEDVLGQIGLTVAGTAPPAALRERILASVAREGRPGVSPSFQIWKNWKGPLGAAAESSVLIRSSEGDWENTGIEGVAVRRLFVDAARKQVTMLIRMAPGARYPSHRHGGAEECYVLQGDLKVGNEVEMYAGDYQRVETGGVHAIQSTREGCLLYITSSVEDEILA